ncbi:MAG TPA: hypothetical protein VEL76_25575 [Gemmataceae bacterium]|nr:hypothetical protein [Gemmataceae bacterium]
MGLHDILGKVRYGDISLPRLARIPDDQVLVEGYQVESFEAGRHYFTVRVDSMSLQHDRRWFTTWQPMLVAVSEFRYSDQEVSVPFVIGPDMLKRRTDAEIPFATVFAATRVAGTHPYVGDRVAVTVLLYRVKHDDYLQRLLRVVGKMAAAFDYATMLSPYLKLASAVIDGIDAVLGHKDTMPVLGHRVEYNPNAGDVFRPGYYAVLPGNAPDSGSLWVHPDHMLRDGFHASAEPVRDDLVLYSITGTRERNDVDSLPWFQPLYERVYRAANTPNEDGKTAAKAHLAIIAEQLRQSPDIAAAQVSALYNKYDAIARSIHEEALSRKAWGPGDLANSEDDLQRTFLDSFKREW